MAHKNIRIEQVPSSALVRCAYEGGGELPAELQGTFTSPRDAKLAIDVYMAKQNRDVEVKVDAIEQEKARVAKGK